MGQMFFSLSLAMGIMVTYGSYMNKSDDIGRSVNRIELFDTGVALLAGFIIIPAVFAFGGAAAAEQAGPGLMFVTLPQVFAATPVAQVLGLVFFALVVFAALTSAISIGEAIVSSVCDLTGLHRRPAVAIVAAGALLLSLLPALGFSLLPAVAVGSSEMTALDLMDFLSNSVLMPVVALLVCLYLGWFAPPDLVREEVESSPGARFGRARLFRVMIRYVAPLFLLAILVSSVLSALGIVSV